MIKRAAAAGRDHRNAGRLHDRLCQIQVKAGLSAVPIHRGEQDLARAARGYLARPCDRVDAGRRAPSRNIYLKARGGLSGLPPVDGHDNALASILLRSRVYQPWIFDRRRVDRNLVRARAQDLAKILHRTDAAADRDRHKHLAAGAAHHVRDRGAVIARRGDIEEHDLVRALGGIELRQLDWIARVAQADKVHALDHPPVLDIQAGNDPFCKHHFASLIAAARLSEPE